MEVSSWLMHAPLSCRPLLKSDAAEDDVAFCKRLTVEAGVTALPVCIRPYRISTLFNNGLNSCFAHI